MDDFKLLKVYQNLKPHPNLATAIGYTRSGNIFTGVIVSLGNVDKAKIMNLKQVASLSYKDEVKLSLLQQCAKSLQLIHNLVNNFSFHFIF